MREARGVDWFPSWARSPVDYWTAAMPAETAERELSFVAGLGLDHVRIWLSAWGYEQDPARYLRNLSFVLDAAHARRLGVVMELFDSCGIEPTTGEAVETRIEEIPMRAADDPRLAITAASAAANAACSASPGS